MTLPSKRAPLYSDNLFLSRWRFGIYLAIIERGWVGYEEFCRSRRVLSTEADSVDNTLRDLQNSSYPTKAEFNNCFIIHSKYFSVLNGVSPFRSLFSCSPKSQSRPQVFFGQRLNNLQRAPLLTSFWRQWLNNLRRTALLTSLIQYDEDSNLVNSSWLWWIMRAV